MENRQGGRAVEAGGRHPVVIADTDHIGIGIVGMEDRVAVAAVAEIGAVRVGVGMFHGKWVGRGTQSGLLRKGEAGRPAALKRFTSGTFVHP